MCHFIWERKKSKFLVFTNNDVNTFYHPNTFNLPPIAYETTLKAI